MKIKILSVLISIILIANGKPDESDGFSNDIYKVEEIKDLAREEKPVWLEQNSDNKKLIKLTDDGLNSIYWISWNKEKTAFVINLRMSTKISKLAIFRKCHDGKFVRVEKFLEADFSKVNLSDKKEKMDLKSAIKSYSPKGWINEFDFSYIVEFDSDPSNDKSIGFDCKMDVSKEIVQETIVKSK